MYYSYKYKISKKKNFLLFFSHFDLHLEASFTHIRIEKRENFSPNAKTQVAKIVKDYLNNEGKKLIGHPLYSPDLAPCDFWLYSEL